MSIASGAPSFVDRTNSIVVAEARRPRTVALTGRSPLLRVWKIRKDLVMSTDEIVTVCVPLAVLTTVPDCICCSAAARATCGTTRTATLTASSSLPMTATRRTPDVITFMELVDSFVDRRFFVARRATHEP